MLAMMVDLEDDPEWSVSDELEDDDSERYICLVPGIKFLIKWKKL